MSSTTAAPIRSAASVLALLRNAANADRVDHGAMLALFAAERLLVRLAAGGGATRYVLKGGMLLRVVLPAGLRRATVDADLLRVADGGTADVEADFRAAIGAAGDDHVVFDPATLRVMEMRHDRGCQARSETGATGWRVTVAGSILKVRLTAQVDIGHGDAVVPAPVSTMVPPLVEGMEGPVFPAYAIACMCAEKLHAVVANGLRNSRLKDLHDLAAIAAHIPPAMADLVAAVRATFAARSTPLPAAMPVGFDAAFRDQPHVASGWIAFRRRNPGAAPDIADAQAAAWALLAPAVAAAREA